MARASGVFVPNPVGPRFLIPEAAVAWVRQHCTGKVDFRALAGKHGLSCSTLRQRFRRVAGPAPVSCLAHLRGERAKQLLSGSGLSITEIGAAVGLAHSVIFCRAFHRCTGSPRNASGSTSLAA